MKTINLVLKTAGCETACMHCWANGGHYKNMPFNDIENIIKSFIDFAILMDINMITMY